MLETVCLEADVDLFVCCFVECELFMVIKDGISAKLELGLGLGYHALAA